MNSVLVFEWFMMMLIAGVAGRSSGYARAGAVALLCAVFWITLCIAVAGGIHQLTDWTLVSLALGTAAILAIAAWTGSDRPTRADAAPASAVERPVDRAVDDARAIQTMLQKFDDWLERYRSDADPWPEFGEFVRGLLFDACGAGRVRPYRILSEDGVLVPLREIDNVDSNDVRPTHLGAIGEFLSANRSLLAGAGDEANDRILRGLTEEGLGPAAWAFPIRQSTRTIGLVLVGEVDMVRAGEAAFAARLATLELIIAQFWSTLLEVCRSRASATTDPVSGLLTRDVMITASEHLLRECYRRREPVAVVVISIEGLRRLDERGLWCVANNIIAASANELAARCRPSDLLGRFDDSRFIMVLRRVDAELAALIGGELVTRLRGLEHTDLPDDVDVTFRAGVVNSGSDTVTLAGLIAAAVEQCHRARRQGETTCAAQGQGGELHEV